MPSVKVLAMPVHQGLCNREVSLIDELVVLRDRIIRVKAPLTIHQIFPGALVVDQCRDAAADEQVTEEEVDGSS